jgi:hypothetical protein
MLFSEQLPRNGSCIIACYSVIAQQTGVYVAIDKQNMIT